MLSLKQQEKMLVVILLLLSETLHSENLYHIFQRITCSY